MLQGIFEGIKKWNEVNNELVECLGDKDLEYLEAASLLHNVGLYAGKKGYHKQSYRIIIVCDPSKKFLVLFYFQPFGMF